MRNVSVLLLTALSFQLFSSVNNLANVQKCHGIIDCLSVYNQMTNSNIKLQESLRKFIDSSESGNQVELVLRSHNTKKDFVRFLNLQGMEIRNNLIHQLRDDKFAQLPILHATEESIPQAFVGTELVTIVYESETTIPLKGKFFVGLKPSDIKKVQILGMNESRIIMVSGPYEVVVEILSKIIPVSTTVDQ